MSKLQIVNNNAFATNKIETWHTFSMHKEINDKKKAKTKQEVEEEEEKCSTIFL